MKPMLGAFALAAVAALWPTPGAAQEKVLKVIPHADLRVLDPIWTTGYITRNHGYLVYDTLFAIDDKFEPKPQMADSFTLSADGLVYTIKLRSGLKWHDGKPVTAADAVASIQRWSRRDGMGQKMSDYVATIAAVDTSTLTITLKEPYGLVIPSLAKISSNVPFMMPEAIAKTDAMTQITEAIGSGPFKFVRDQWVPGNKVVYVRNADYVPRSEAPSFASGGKHAKVDRVEWYYVPDATTALAALQRGEYDYWEIPPIDMAPIIEKDPNLKLEITDKLGQQGWLRPNHLHPPFNNPKIRQALVHALDQGDYLKAMIGPETYWQICRAYFVCGTPLATQAGAEGLKPDLAKAKALLAEAGYKGEPVVLMDPTDIPASHAASLVTAQRLKEIGMNVDLQAMDWSTLLGRRAKKDPPTAGGWSLLHTWWTGADVLTPINNIGMSGGCEAKAWFGWYCDPEMEKLRDQYAKAPNAAEQKRIAEAIQKRAYEQVPYVITGQWVQPTAYSRRLNGVLSSPVPFFWNIEKRS
jgi:peptide/nickel transport system substrate-binding protein